MAENDWQQIEGESKENGGTAITTRKKKPSEEMLEENWGHLPDVSSPEKIGKICRIVIRFFQELTSNVAQHTASCAYETMTNVAQAASDRMSNVRSSSREERN